MLGLKENRERLINRAIDSIQKTALIEAEDIQEFEYEPSEIINALFEDASESSESNESKKFKDRKLQKEQEITFFPNSNKYIKSKKGTI